MKLTATKVKKAKPAEKAYKLSDGDGNAHQGVVSREQGQGHAEPSKATGSTKTLSTARAKNARSRVHERDTRARTPRSVSHV